MLPLLSSGQFSDFWTVWPFKILKGETENLNGGNPREIAVHIVLGPMCLTAHLAILKVQKGPDPSQAGF